MLGISATAWAMLCALRQPHRYRLWLAVGLLAGTLVLSKYQALVPLAGFVLAAWLSGGLASSDSRSGLLAATLVALAVIAPHVEWTVQHQFTTVGYAVQEGGSLSWPGRGWSVSSFLAQQIRLLLPALAFAAVLLCLPRLMRSAVPPVAAPVRLAAPPEVARQGRAWLIGLVAFPLFATVLVSVVFGLRLQNHWGYQALQFGSIWLAWRIRPHTSRAGPAWLAALLLVHAAYMTVTLCSVAGADRRRGRDIRRRRWLKRLAVIGATTRRARFRWSSGRHSKRELISVYSGGTALVLEDGEHGKSPWITPSDLERRGAVHVSSRLEWLPSRGVTRIGSLDVSAASPPPNDRVYWAIIPPQACPEAG